MLLDYILKPILYDYDNFSGRTSRKQFWLFFILLLFVLLTLFFILGMIVNFREKDSVALFWGFWGFLDFALSIPITALLVRRLHDIGKSGYWLFFVLFPLIGFIVLFLWLGFGKSSPDNQYGSMPTEY
jgi:uncharacterized membrane protein YhaH (DUF805 family)